MSLETINLYHDTLCMQEKSRRRRRRRHPSVSGDDGVAPIF